MKITFKLFAIILTLIFVAALAGVLVTTVDAAQNHPLKIWAQNENGRFMTLVVVDENTGVNYVVVNYDDPHGSGVAIVPRYNADGSLYVTD